MSTVHRWLRPLPALLPDVTPTGWNLVTTLDGLLDRLIAGSDRIPTSQPAQSRWLMSVRRELAAAGYAALGMPAPYGCGQPAAVHALAQFVCGYHDADLRDATGPGHGMLVTGAREPLRSHWLDRISVGDLIGIAATERHGGSRIREITTCAMAAADGRWEICGEKTWVSRLTEAAAFVVFFRDPEGQITAALVDSRVAGLRREAIAPAGLGGWTWGVLRFDRVRIDPRADVLVGPGAGLRVFRDHFARFRPLVTATALGAAARAHDCVAEALATRLAAGTLTRVRDNALITLGRSRAELHAALLAVLATARLAADGHADADLWARISKAHGVDTAHRAVTDLVPLIGAAGFQNTSRLVKIRNDLTGLLYADGIHDSLYRSGGQTLLRGLLRAAATDSEVDASTATVVDPVADVSAAA